MDARVKPRRLEHEFDRVALALQGGGALGAYQAGAYAALFEQGVLPDWVVGVSIGAINAALIAGNPPERRIQAIDAFWHRITRFMPGQFALPDLPVSPAVTNWITASRNLMFGQPAFFKPRVPPPLFWPQDTEQALSYYDITPLRDTLLEFVDFDRLNDGPVRVSVGAVDIYDGNTLYFDSRERRLGPEHIMASGALPPGFPPVEVEGRWYWDGGLASNTPLDYIMHDTPRPDTLVFQIDLWPAKGEFPRNIIDVGERAKEIQYSSRTRLNSTQAVREMQLKRRVRTLLGRLRHEDEEADALMRELEAECAGGVATIVHLIYQARPYEHDSKDYNFGRRMMEEHWHSGEADVARVFRLPDLLEKPTVDVGIRVVASDKVEGLGTRVKTDR